MPGSFSTPGCVSRDQYWQLVEDGHIHPDDRVELLDGVIVAMAPQNPPHAFVIAKLTHLFSMYLGGAMSIRVQLPLELGGFSVPEPDFAVVRGLPNEYATAHPTSALLVVEVSDRSLPQDRITKGRIYAAGSVPEYWIVNLRDGCVEVHSTPLAGERRWAERRVAVAGERLEPVAVPGVSIAVADVLPPPR